MPQSSTRPIGDCAGVSLEVAAWDVIDAPVDLSAACLFQDELPDALLASWPGQLGGLAPGASGQSAFRGRPMEAQLVFMPQPGQRARALMLVGLGEPAALTPRRMARVTQFIVGAAAALDAASIRFAPRLPGALSAAQASALGEAMVAGLVEALTLARSPAARERADGLALRRWIFEAEAAQVRALADALRPILTARQASSAV